MAKQTIAVLFGGVSSEHEISCISAAFILNNLDPEKYDIYPIGITKDGRFLSYSGSYDAISECNWDTSDQAAPCLISPDRSHHGMLRVSEDHSSIEIIRLDCVIPALHGKNGEDGTIQGLFQLADIPFVGCDTISSAMCMDKQYSHVLLESAGIPMAKWICVQKGQRYHRLEEAVAQKLGYPVFVKPANAGSSVGVSKVSGAEALQHAIDLAMQEDDKVLIEEAINGKEVECAVLGYANPEASISGEIKPSKEFYDYEAKYESDESELYIPAHISEQAQEYLRRIALQAFQVMGCSGLCRVDFFVTENEAIILNELNTFPGFTNISMYPKLWESMGVSNSQLLDRFIAYAMERAQTNE